MNEKEIIEGNKLIAEFMGEDVLPLKDGDLYPLIKGEHGLKQTKYHTSWDWLMPVVEKIESLETVTVSILPNCCTIFGFNEEPPYINKRTEIKIEAVWLAVVSFIKDYNKTK